MKLHAVVALSSIFVLSSSVAFADPLPPPEPGPGSGSGSGPGPGPGPGQSTPVATEPPSQSSSSIHVTYESSRVDRPAAGSEREREKEKKSPDDSTVLHGFRLGYGFVMNSDKPTEGFGGQSLEQKVGLRSPHHFLLGYEVLYRVVSHSWLNVLLLANAMVAGIEQSKFLPSGNLLIGAEIKNSFQVGVGANLSPLKGSEAHAVVAAGWTPKVGTIYTPFHFYFIPDVDGVHRMGVTTGVTF